MNWQTNWAANPQCSGLTSENFRKMQHITSRASLESVLSSLRSSSAQLSESNASFLHNEQLGSNSIVSLQKDCPAYHTTNCSSYLQLLTSPLNFAQIENLVDMPWKANEHSVRQPYEADVTRQLSQSLECNLAGTLSDPPVSCLSSNLAQYLQQSVLQHGEPFTTNSVAGRLVLEQSNLNNNITHNCIAHYPFESDFVEPAAIHSSFRRDSCFATSSAVGEQLKFVELSGANSAVGEISPRTVNSSSKYSPSEGQSVSFVASYEDVSERFLNCWKHQMLESCTSTGVHSEVQDIEKMANLDLHSCCQQIGQKLEQSEAVSKRFDEDFVHFCVEDACNKNDGIAVKKRRLENDDNLNINTNTDCETLGGAARYSKGKEHTGDGNAGKRRKCRNSPKGKEEGKGRITSSEETRPNVGGKDKCMKVTDPPKQDYIHVRARRGQATDSHSLAERVRREKISERMRFLQDLVPGCSKISGKAMMLDEIINYVQSLQHQVEFLSTKLAALSPRLDASFDSIFMGEVVPATGSPTEAGTISEMGTSSAILSYQMLQCSFPVRDSPENLSAPMGNAIHSETLIDRAIRDSHDRANLAGNASCQVACKWDAQKFCRSDGA